MSPANTTKHKSKRKLEHLQANETNLKLLSSLFLTAVKNLKKVTSCTTITGANQKRTGHGHIPHTVHTQVTHRDDGDIRRDNEQKYTQDRCSVLVLCLLLAAQPKTHFRTCKSATHTDQPIISTLKTCILHVTQNSSDTRFRHEINASQLLCELLSNFVKHCVFHESKIFWHICVCPPILSDESEQIYFRIWHL